MIRSIYSIRLRSFKYYYTCINKRNLLDMNLKLYNMSGPKILFFFFMFYHQEVPYNISYSHGHLLMRFLSPLCRKCEF